MFVYHMGHYTNVMNDLSYDEIRQIEFSTLRKLLLEKYVATKIKALPEQRKMISMFVKNLMDSVLSASSLIADGKETMKKAGQVVSDKWNEWQNIDGKE